MGRISRGEAWEVFLRFGFNSSHFVWFINSLEFYQTENGTLFAFTERNQDTFFALEPLNWNPATLKDAWEEMKKEIKTESFAFIGVEQNFTKVLQAIGFSTMKVAEEPWVNLRRRIASGNKSKKARSARNLAKREGVEITHTPANEIEKDTSLRSELDTVYKEWEKCHTLHLGSFLNNCDPYFQSERRNYFLARKEGKLVGALVVSPVPGRNGVFLEDLVQLSSSPNGTGELLVFTALDYMKNLKIEWASLGAVALRNLGQFHKIPFGFKTVIKIISPILQNIANYSGIGVFRDHFNPESWESLYIAFGNRKGKLETRKMVKTLYSLYELFRGNGQENPVSRQIYNTFST